MRTPIAKITERLGYSDQTVFPRAILRIRRAICRRAGDDGPSCTSLPDVVVLQNLQTVQVKPEDRKTEADREGDQNATPFSFGSLSKHNLLASTVQKTSLNAPCGFTPESFTTASTSSQWSCLAGHVRHKLSIVLRAKGVT
jgi:hypothetical protein